MYRAGLPSEARRRVAASRCHPVPHPTYPDRGYGFVEKLEAAGKQIDSVVFRASSGVSATAFPRCAPARSVVMTRNPPSGSDRRRGLVRPQAAAAVLNRPGLIVA
ncbi:hypothetical protein BMS3Abin12_01314 [bacterium BMS3Abin12]|nr:hypothetical protein BMS3Abin12_01314 [bacterium BMS3Abin12]GBE49329.1 hypothetical protein BMS3Bbin13_00248 [bacterium BMS3Bbin13]